MSQLSNWAEENILNYVVRGTSLAFPSNWYLALYVSDPGETGSGTEVSIGDWTNYVRQPIARSAAAWTGSQADAGGGAVVRNGNTLNFGNATIAQNVSVSHWALHDASSGGNIWWYGTLTTSRLVQDGNPVTVGVGLLQLILSGALSDFAEGALLDHILAASTLTFPTNWDVALFTGSPTDAGGGPEVDTGDWTNYARVSVARSAGAWSAAASEGGGGFRVANASIVSFGTATIVSPPTLSHWAMYNAGGGGELWFHDALTAGSGAVANGDAVRFAAGVLAVGFR